MRITNHKSSSVFSIFFCLFTFAFSLHSQEVTLDYIFQDSAVITPRPSIKTISTISNKVYYYADDDFNNTLDLFEYNYVTSETYKYPDSTTVSEFTLLPNGDCVSLIDGDLFISKNFTNTRNFSKDVQLTKTDQYEYSPKVYNDLLIYRRSGDYFGVYIDSLNKKEIRLTNDESDTISYQILAVTNKLKEGNTIQRIFFARYDNSTREQLFFPDYNDKYVKVNKQSRGMSKVKYLEYELSYKKPDSLIYKINEIAFPDSIRLSTQYSIYSPDVKNLILDAETTDRHNRKIFNYDIASKSIKQIYTESFENGWFERHDNPTRFITDDELIFESEISGYANIYKIKRDGSDLKKIAGDNYTILESVVDEKNESMYFIANKENPQEYYIYETDFERNTFKQLTSINGADEELKITRDGKYLFYEHSFINKPKELWYLMTDDYRAAQFTNTPPPKFASIDWVLPELISFANEEDGQNIDAFVYKPKDFNLKKKYPLICFAHGAGYLQNVTWGLSPYQDNFMVNTFLVSQGFVVLDVDFRGSRGYGVEFRNKTYRNLGYWEVSDYISGINYLDKLGYINKDKVGIYGGSYGGFITLMAAMRHPEYFKCGAALRAVANWQLYYLGNRWFTMSRLGDLNKDEDVKKYYDQSSPITYAQELQVPVLLLHGMLDDNVFFQDMVQLTQKLIENKKDFEVMIYPKEYHSFRLQTSWLDEYKRIWKFFEKLLK